MPKKFSPIEEPETKVRRRRRTVAADDAPKSTAKKSARTKKVETPKPDYSNREKIYALDIGTRSVIGIVAVKEDDDTLTIIATQRKEHKTRAMLDGQIHDVPKVAAIIRDVTDALEQEVGKLQSAAVAAAGRELFTVTADASIEPSGSITDDEERNLEFAAVQNAQNELAAQHSLDPTSYYCVGFSTIKYELDGVRLKSLVGQRGKVASSTVIATFLPKQVIDSIQSALKAVNLEMHALTLEPIAAINVLILPSMRHLNLVLVDIGAGTSDVAITKNGSIIAYGMVPVAGDEITDAISQNFLLDFNIAEEVKRRASVGERSEFDNILGDHFDLTPEEVIEPISDAVQNLAQSIANTILELNGQETPQAVMLVGGGSLTPNLHTFVAEALNMPKNRVAVRNPDVVEGITSIPKELRLPDAVTPLGILKIASIKSLHFMPVYVNDIEHNLFHFRNLTISDALLTAGINLKKFNGKPGLGAVITVNGVNKTFKGTMGSLARVTLNDQDAGLDAPITPNCRIKVIRGLDGQPPQLNLSNVIDEIPSFDVTINGNAVTIGPRILLNGSAVDLGSDGKSLNLSIIGLNDGDVVETRMPRTVGEALRNAGYPPTGRRINYTLNGREAHYTCSPKIILNELTANIALPIKAGDVIEYDAQDAPKIADIVNAKEVTVKFNYKGEGYKIPATDVHIKLNGRSATLNTIVDDEAIIQYRAVERQVTVSDALLAINFKAPDARSRTQFEIKVNGESAEFSRPIMTGDTLEINLSKNGDRPPEMVEQKHTSLLKNIKIADLFRKD